MKPLTPLRTLLLFLAALLGGCHAEPASRSSPKSDLTPMRVQRGSLSGLAKPSESPAIEYVNKIDNRYSAVRIHNSKGDIVVLDDTYGKYEKEAPPFMSDSGNIVLLHQIDSGKVQTLNGVSRLHERYYCTFVDVRDGCVLERRTGEFCSGNWTKGDRWVDFNGRSVDIGSKRLTAEAALSEDEPPPEDPVWNYDNLLRCDPVGAVSRASYSELLESNVFSLPDQKLENAKKAMEKGK